MPFPVAQLEHLVGKVLDQIKKNPQLKNLFSKLKIDRTGDYMQARIGTLINISTSLSVKLEWNTDKTLEKFVFAAYLHDMALEGRSDLVKISNAEMIEKVKSSLSESDYKLLLEHSIIATDTLMQYKEIPDDVVVMVKQHHELPKETGYPGKISHQKITPLSTVFIVAHDLTDYIMSTPNWKLDKYLLKAREKFRGSHFNKVLSALADMT
jgi:HD-GYP domain-containing protein (c-di-GMP phosphodiesterase class II)